MSNPDPESVSILLQILLLIFLTALNAFIIIIKPNKEKLFQNENKNMI